MGFNILVQRLEAEYSVWYLDNVTIGDSPENVVSCIWGLIVAFREIGLEIKQRKSELVFIHKNF